MLRIWEEMLALFRLARRNVLRQRTRTAMTLAAIAFGVIGLILSGGFVQDIFLQLGEAVIHSQSGHLQVAKTGFAAHGARRPQEYLMRDPQSLKSRVTREPGVSDV